MVKSTREKKDSLDKGDEEITKMYCGNCNSEIVNKYNHLYNGERGTCPICGIDFPLE
jgi:hydrogenase maturation factor HypF (carbamoyltransferase family)